MANFRSFWHDSFQGLTDEIEEWLKHAGGRPDTRVLSVSCYTDGAKHYAMIATAPIEVIICHGEKQYEVGVTAGGSLCVQTADADKLMQTIVILLLRNVTEGWPPCPPRKRRDPVRCP